MTASLARRAPFRGGSPTLAGVLALLLVAACDSGPVAPPGPTVASVSIVASVGDLQIGETAQLSAILRDAQGGPVTGAAITWSTSDGSIASVSDGGLVTGLGNGNVTITASAQGRSGTIGIPVRPPDCLVEAATRSIAVGETLAGSLERNDCFIFDRNAQGWRLSVSERTRLLMDLTSSAFDAILLVTDLDLQILTGDDDGGEGSNARLAWIFQPGDYILWALSYEEGEVGGYGLSVQLQADTSCEDPVGAVTPGAAVTGALTHTSCIIPSGHFADRWSLELAAPAHLRFDLTSPVLDAHVSVLDAEGTLLGEDDLSGDGLNARLDLELAAGSYTVWASSFWTGEVGPYELRLTPLAGGAALPTRLDPGAPDR